MYPWADAFPGVPRSLVGHTKIGGKKNKDPDQCRRNSYSEAWGLYSELWPVTQRLQFAFREFMAEGSTSPLNMNDYTCAAVRDASTKKKGWAPVSTKLMGACCASVHGIKSKLVKVSAGKYECEGGVA